MAELRKHDRCKHFGYNKCRHRNDEVMRQATRFIPEYHGGKYQTTSSSPSAEEIDRICCDCNSFTLR
jgi:hypothetical protein